MRFFHLFVLLTTATGVLSALTASNAQPKLSTVHALALSNETVNVTGPSSPQKQKRYHVPNSPTTLVFISYTAPRTITPTASFQTLVTALNSIYHSTVVNHGDGRIFTNVVSWSYGGATIFIENHGHDRTLQLTWGMLVDTMLGVGTFLGDTFLEGQGPPCWSGEWMIEIEGLGNIGSGSIGPKVGKDGEAATAGVGFETA